MNICECPVCDEQFELQTILEDHVFKHSTWIRQDENTSSKSGHKEIIDESSQCKQRAVTFASNASLNIHKNSYKFIFRSD